MSGPDDATWVRCHVCETAHAAPPCSPPVAPACDHGVTFDEAQINAPAGEVRRRWPRLHGECPKGCGFSGIAYASMGHYIAGDW